MDLLLDIARCKNVIDCLELQGNDHPCFEIVRSQGAASLTDFHCPEPWSGDLVNAPVLFISSNPSVDINERYPRWSWPNGLVVDFFTNRFSSKHGWVKNALFPMLEDASYRQDWVRFWAAVRQRARELFDKSDVRPGIDYAITEIVHCKSAREIGVKAATEECSSRFLGVILAASKAKVVICLGIIVRDVIHRKLGLQPGMRCLFSSAANDESARYYIFLPHPNARGARTIGDFLSSREIAAVRGFLGKPNQASEMKDL